MNQSVNTRPSALSTAAQVNVAAIVGFGAMIVVQILGGVDDYPVIPPGLVISVLVAVVVVLANPWRWSAVVGFVWPVFLTVGAAAASQTGERITGDDGSFVLVTSVVQLAVLATALVSGLVAVVQRYRSGS